MRHLHTKRWIEHNNRTSKLLQQQQQRCYLFWKSDSFENETTFSNWEKIAEVASTDLKEDAPTKPIHKRTLSKKWKPSEWVEKLKMAKQKRWKIMTSWMKRMVEWCIIQKSTVVRNISQNNHYPNEKTRSLERKLSHENAILKLKAILKE